MLFTTMTTERAEKLRAAERKVNNLQARIRNQKKRMDMLAEKIAEYIHSDYCAGTCGKACDKRYWLSWSYTEMKKRRRAIKK